MSGSSVIFDPLLPWPVIWLALGLSAAFVALAIWRRLGGWWLRALALGSLVLALAGPSLQTEINRALSDIVILVVDQSSSQGLSGRREQTAEAVARIRAEVAALPDTELREVTVPDGADDTGTLAMTALAQAVAEEPRARIAGAIMVTDGQVHDLAMAPALPAPLNVLLTGRDADWDRRLVVTTAPAFGIIGEPLQLALRIDEQGRMPAAEKGRAVQLAIAVDGGEPQSYAVPVNENLTLPVTLSHGGQNVIQLTLETSPGELTDKNNMAVVQINGVRDRLRVLLISGEPYAGERTWRNLLKSDASVDLVHFTILRPPEKQDGVPVNELSLIAFPTRELFVDKIDQFDLIIFDRYKLRGILPSAYLDNIRDYILKGGAVLVAAGEDYASAESLYYSGLGEVLPAAPTGRVVAEGFTPEVTDIGKRHPVTEGLETAVRGEGAVQAPAAKDGKPEPWGRWLRMVEVSDPQGQVVMDGADKRPLLVLNHAGEGRVALLASDQSWLWSRGFEGGGPQLELLRRLAHWLMKEPDLEEEALTVSAKGQVMTITRRSLKDTPREVTVTAPDGSETKLALTETEPGKYTATWAAPTVGLYRLSDGELDRVYALGPAAPKEFEDTIASDAKLLPAARATEGGALRLEQGMPDVRTVRAGRPAIGRGWVGITPRYAHVTTDLRVSPILPAWTFLLLAAGLAIAAWLVEGRSVRRRA